MAASHINDAELLDALRSPCPADTLDRALGGAVVVESDEGGLPTDLAALSDAVGSLPCVIVGVSEVESPPLAMLYDVVLDPRDAVLPAVLQTVGTNPVAATALAVLLRAAESRSVADGLATESAVYSTLQDGPEFAAWRAGTPLRSRAQPDSPTVRVERVGDQLLVALARPEVHNAFSARMRDDLLDALTLAVTDSTIAEVVLTGDGPSFCSGGDLDEFGSRPDPATAHMVRLARSVGRVIAAMSGRVTVRIHGGCMGSGIELAAFAHRVVAHPDTQIALPEVGMGLVPGAGGTVSLPRRIGRQRTALLALCGTTIDAETARQWGLVDEIDR